MRIAFWTTASLEPEIEAISKEVFQLAACFPQSFIFGISRHHRVRGSIARRYIGLHPRFDPLLRIAIPVIECAYDINHVYGEPTPWTFYKALRSKPIVLTVASEKGLPRADFFARCQKIIVQTSSYHKRLTDFGVEREKLELLYPGVDLRRFHPREDLGLRKGMPNVLFATAPRTEAELTSRGVLLLLESAKLQPAVNFHLLYRRWQSGYTSLSPTLSVLESSNLRNVTLINRNVRDMPAVYRDHDFTVIPYTTPDGGKECPTSAVEGLACGIPALISSKAPFADFVADHKCGVVFDPTPHGLATAVEIGIAQYADLSANALHVAREYFSLETFLRRMTQVYEAAHS
jgi:glycosyltransferase involved in cell wall biosynthesis